MAERFFEVRVRGSLGPAALQAFADFSVDREPATTVLSGSASQEELHSLLDRVRALGLELVDVKEVHSQPGHD